MSHAIGIDLGTTNSAVAVLRANGRPEILRNAEGDSTTPSVVFFQSYGDGDEPQVGALAKRAAALSPYDVVQFVKRFIGDPDWRFESTSGASYTSEEISAIVLTRLKQDAELALGGPVSDAVITVPAYFDDARRTATRQAGTIAGLNVLRVLNEPTAAALSYGLDTQTAGTILVYDLGGGTFDVTVLRIKDAEFEVLATAGDRNLGGYDFDNALITHAIADLVVQGARGIDDNDTAMADLREKAEYAKRSLSNQTNTQIQVTFEDKHYRVQVSREDFERISKPLLERTEELVDETLSAAGLTWNQIDRVLLVGGSTRIPAVRDLVQRISGKPVELDVNPDEAVALGAAIQAALEQAAAGGHSGAEMVLFQGQQISIKDVTSQGLGVILLDENEREVNSIVISPNTAIPTKGARGASTATDNQTRLRIRVTQGDDEDIEFVTVVGESVLEIPAYPKGAPIEVVYHYDVDQTIQVEVIDKTTDTSLGNFEIDRLANLSDADVMSASAKISELSVS